VLQSLAPRDNLTLLYRDHARWLQGWIRRRLGCQQRAADLTQTTFCRLLERGCAAPPDSPRGFLATVARRLLIDELRHREVELAYAQCHLALHGEANLLTPERITEATQLLHDVLALLATLPADVRRAYLLRRIDGLANEQIAAMLGVSTRTVKRHVAQAYMRFYACEFAH
jgi:RNA polymerase sigma-70 factor (ECF subfamily)